MIVKELKKFIIEIILKNKVILKLSIEDLRKRFSGSAFGIIWTFIQPIFNILVLWIVFSIGFRASTVTNVPFIAWLMSGLIPWYFYTDGLIGASNSVMEYRFILKQMSFTPSIIPLIKIGTAFLSHIVFLFILFIVLTLSNIPFSFYWFQLIYYMFALFILLLGLGWLSAAIKVFFYDIGEMINISIQVGMWLTPILWNSDLISPKLEILFKLNPMYYIVQGYRDSLLYNISILDRLDGTVIFWMETLFVFLAGIIIFSRLEHHFNEVL